MKADVLDLSGKPKEKIDLPKVFAGPVRHDLILRAVLSTQSKKRHPYGTDTMAGKRTSAHYHGSRHADRREVMMGREMARMPRIHGDTSSHLMWRPRFVPQAKGGRSPHPPVVERDWVQKINKKERRKAIASAIAATVQKELVAKRHAFDGKLPLIIEDKIQDVKKTKEVISIFKSLGLEKELKRIKERKIRAGKGKMRGRIYKKRTGPLIVITDDKGIGKAVRNIPGVHVCWVNNLGVEQLAPGTMPGRLTIFTKSAIEKLGEK